MQTEPQDQTLIGTLFSFGKSLWQHAQEESIGRDERRIEFFKKVGLINTNGDKEKTDESDKTSQNTNPNSTRENVDPTNQK